MLSFVRFMNLIFEIHFRDLIAILIRDKDNLSIKIVFLIN